MRILRKFIFFIFLAGIVFSPVYYLKFKTKKFPSEEYLIKEGSMCEGDILGDILVENGLTYTQAYNITNQLKKVFNVRRCGIGDKWKIYFDKDGNFVKFVYQHGPVDYYVVRYDKEKGCYNVKKKKIKAEKKLVGAKGKIQSSLYESMRKIGINPEIIIQFAEIFSSKVDFFTDCRNGDEFAILWNSYTHNGEILQNLHICAAMYKSEYSTYYAFYFKLENGKSGYYDEKGKSVESAFLKAPLHYRRISSYFSYRRFHPILKIYRPHLGIDYAAPYGTPVSAIGDGRVIFAGWTKNGYGIAVKIKHPNGYISYYGHLSRIKKGIRAGKLVKKGQVIGYVGATGLATGPHLDFRLKKNGRFINFLKLKMPPSYPLPSKYLDEFEKVKGEMMEKLNSLKDGQITLF